MSGSISKAQAYMKSQLRDGRMTPDGIAFKFETMRGDSLDTFKHHLNELDGEIWTAGDYYLTNYSNRFQSKIVYTLIVFIPDANFVLTDYMINNNIQ